MGFQTVITLAGNGLIFWAAAVGVTSVVVHLRVFDRHSAMSVHLLCYMVAIGAVLTLACFRIIFGDSEWFQLIRLVVFIGVPIFMTQRLILQIKAQRGGAPKKPQDGSA